MAPPVHETYHVAMRTMLLTLTLLAAMGFVTGCKEPPPASDPKRPEILGFDSLHWGQAPTNDMAPFRTHEGKTDYRRENPPENLGEVPLKTAVYTFRQGKLSAIRLVADSRDPRRVAAELSQRWGPPDRQKHGQILWQRGPVRVAVFQAILPEVQVEMVHEDLLDPREP